MNPHEEINELNEPQAPYGNRIGFENLEKLDEKMLMHTQNFTPEQRLEYLQKLRAITRGNQETDVERVFQNSRLQINKPDGNI